MHRAHLFPPHLLAEIRVFATLNANGLCAVCYTIPRRQSIRPRIHAKC